MQFGKLNNLFFLASILVSVGYCYTMDNSLSKPKFYTFDEIQDIKNDRLKKLHILKKKSKPLNNIVKPGDLKLLEETVVDTALTNLKQLPMYVQNKILNYAYPEIESWLMQYSKCLKGHTDIISCLAISSDGKKIATGSYDFTAKIWNANTGDEIATLKHEGPVRHLAISPDGLHIITVENNDRIVNVWDMKGSKICTLVGFFETAFLFFLADNHIITGSKGGKIKIWPKISDIKINQDPIKEIEYNDFITCAAISPNAKIAICSHYTLNVWNGESHKEFNDNQNKEIGCFAYDGKHIAIGQKTLEPNIVSIWDENRKELKSTINLDTRYLYSLSILLGQNTLITGSNSKKVTLWDMTTGKKLLSLKGHTDSVTNVASFPDGNGLVTGSMDKTARIWEFPGSSMDELSPRQFALLKLIYYQQKVKKSSNKKFRLPLYASEKNSDDTLKNDFYNLPQKIKQAVESYVEIVNERPKKQC